MRTNSTPLHLVSRAAGLFVAALIVVAALAAASPAEAAPQLRIKRTPDTKVMVLRGQGFQGQRGRVVIRFRGPDGVRRVVKPVQISPRRGGFVVRQRVRRKDTTAVVRVRVAGYSKKLTTTQFKLAPKPAPAPQPAPVSEPAPAPSPTETTPVPEPSLGAEGDPAPAPAPAPAPVPAPAPAPAPDPAYGPKPSYTPSGDVVVNVGQLNQALIDSSPMNTRFVIAAGVHRLSAPLKPKSGQQFLGRPGSVVSGSKVVTNWTAANGRWYADGQTQEFARVPEVHPSLGIKYCDDSSPMCRHPEGLFRNGLDLRQVTSLSALQPGTFYFDYAADRVYVADDPNGNLMEATQTQHAFNGGGPNVRIQNLVVRQFATPTQTPAMIDAGSGGWQVIDSEIRDAHASGVRVAGDGVLVRGNHIHTNGQIGLKIQGANGLVDGNRISRNNTQGYRQGFESGGTKFAYTTNLVARNNWVHDNIGNGLWTDIDNIHTLYENNLVENNAWKGIFHEISYDAVIRNNVVRGNGWKSQYWFDGAGINVGNSRNVEVYGNVVENNMSGITGRQDSRYGPGRHGAWDLRDLNVHHNVVRHTGARNTVGVSGFAAGLASFEGSTSPTYTTKNNRYSSNTYKVGSTSAINFAFKNLNHTWSGWKSFSLDTTGALSGL